MECYLEIVAPIAGGMAVVGEHGIVEEDAETVEIGAEAVEDDDIGRDEEEIAARVEAGS